MDGAESVRASLSLPANADLCGGTGQATLAEFQRERDCRQRVAEGQRLQGGENFVSVSGPGREDGVGVWRDGLGQSDAKPRDVCVCVLTSASPSITSHLAWLPRCFVLGMNPGSQAWRSQESYGLNSRRGTLTTITVPCPDPLSLCSSPQPSQDPPAQKGPTVTTKVRRTMSSRVHEAVKAIALCHNVTPVYECNGVTDQAEAEKQFEDSCRVYQASSPDEVTLAGEGLSHAISFLPGPEAQVCVALTICVRPGPGLLDSVPPAHSTWLLTIEPFLVLETVPHVA